MSRSPEQILSDVWICRSATVRPVSGGCGSAPRLAAGKYLSALFATYSRLMTDPTPEIDKAFNDAREDERAERDEAINDEIETTERIADEIAGEEKK
jgi:hypothetical protein